MGGGSYLIGCSGVGVYATGGTSLLGARSGSGDRGYNCSTLLYRVYE